MKGYNNGISNNNKFARKYNKSTIYGEKKNWIEINDQSREVYNSNSDIKFKTTLLKFILCDYRDAYMLVTRRVTITGAGADAAAWQEHERDKGVIFKNCTPCINCKSEINNTEINNAKNVDIVIPIYNMTEYSDNYSKISGILWKYYRNERNNMLADSESFKSKMKLAGRSPDDGNTKDDVEIIVPLKHLSNFCHYLILRLVSF